MNFIGQSERDIREIWKNVETSGNILKAKAWEDGHAREDGFRDYFLFHYRLSSVLSNVILRKDTLQAYLVDPPGSDTWDFT